MVPVEPCGVPVELLRSCYTTRMIFRTGDPSIPVRWYFRDKQAFLPFPTSFNSRNWLTDHVWDTQPVGEDPTAPREWVDGSGPDVVNCCEAPYGDPVAWIQGATPGTPEKVACPWILYPSRAELQFEARSTVQNPRFYKSRAILDLEPRSKTVSPKHYAGRAILDLEPRSQVVSPKHYAGRAILDLEPRSITSRSRYYVGRATIDLEPRSQVLSPRNYLGRVPLMMLPNSKGIPGRWYKARAALDLVPNSESSQGKAYVGRAILDLEAHSTYSRPNPTIVYGSCTGGMFTVWNLSVSGFGGFCASMNGNYVLTYDPSVQAFYSSATLSTGQPVWEFHYNGFPSFFWSMSGRIPGNIISWVGSIGFASWHCLAANTFPITGSGSCPSFPSSLTVRPA